MQTTEKLAALRAAMEQAGVDAVYVPSGDPHMSEYLPAHWRCRAWLSGFDGSAGTLCVTADKAALWTDGRYFIQAARQLAGSGIELMRMAVAGTPEIEDWLAEALPANGILAVDGAVTSAAAVEKLAKRLEKADARVVDKDLVSPVWAEGRPAVPATPAWLMDGARAGKTAGEKLADVRAALAGEEADAVLLSRLDSVAWLCNLRADDIEYNPFALAYCLVEKEGATLFVNSARLPAGAQEALAAEGVALAPYEAVAGALRAMQGATVLYEAAGTSWALLRAMEDNSALTLKAGEEPVQALKGVKNEVELRNIKEAHRKDGAAMVRFEMELRRRLAAGVPTTELDASAFLLDLRRAQPGNMGASFETIAAYGPNAAMMHYAPRPGACAVLEPAHFLLVDSGGQYADGTTDITRTYALGPVTEEERRDYTLVLKCHIGMARAVFKEGSAGMHIDILARETLWRLGLDYRCGTGHGVGYVGGVHEGPQNLSQRGKTPFVPGMTITDEPGIYEEGKLGIRIENELVCVPVCETEYGKFYGFEPITYCPIDTRPVDTGLLTDEELCWLNDYHALVQRELAPYLDEAENAWLAEACRPLER